MTGLAFLAWRHAQRRWGRSTVLIVCLAVAMALPVTSRVLVARFDASLHARAGTTPLVVGAKGSRFDLVFGALYFRAAELGTTTVGRYEWLLDEPGVEAIPVHARFTTRGSTPIVATTLEYSERRGLRVVSGRRPAFLGEAMIGAAAAAQLGIEPGDELFSDQRGSFDLTSAQSIRMPVVGVLAAAGTPDDDAVFVDLETAWVLEGATHGHTAADEVNNPDLVIGASEAHVALSNAIREVQEITPENAASFHLHGERRDLPLTAILVWPVDDKARTILSGRVDQSPGDQAVVPTRVIDELMAFVIRIRQVFDAIAAVLTLSTAVLIGLIGVLSYRIREDEMRTLGEIGASRFAVVQLFGMELLGLLVIGAALAGVLVLSSLKVVTALVPVV